MCVCLFSEVPSPAPFTSRLLVKRSRTNALYKNNKISNEQELPRKITIELTDRPDLISAVFYKLYVYR